MRWRLRQKLLQKIFNLSTQYRTIQNVNIGRILSNFDVLATTMKLTKNYIMLRNKIINY